MDNKYFNTPSPAFSNFRELLDKWDKHCILEEQKKSIHDIMDRHGLNLFFKKGNDLFGSPEESRLIFAKLKNDTKDQDDPLAPNFRDEAKFSAINLFKSMFGSDDDSVETLFGNTDIPEIHVCDRDEVVNLIMTHKPKKEKSTNGITISKR